MCRQSSRTIVLDIAARRFCESNRTYRADYADILTVSPEMQFPIARCTGCGFVYAIAEPEADFLWKVYDDVIDHDANLRANDTGGSFANRMRYVAELLELAPPSQRHVALDYGCGLGHTSRVLQAAGVETIGFEPSLVRLGHAARLSKGPMVSERDGLRAAAPFDIIVCDNVLEHLADPSDTVRFLGSVAAAGAVLYVSVPDFCTRVIQAQCRAHEAGAPLDMSVNPWEHLNYFDLSHLDQLLDSGGFKPISEDTLTGAVNIGLRRHADVYRRLKNSCASGLRLVRYAATGSALRTPNRAFYRIGNGESRQ